MGSWFCYNSLSPTCWGFNSKAGRLDLLTCVLMRLSWNVISVSLTGVNCSCWKNRKDRLGKQQKNWRRWMMIWGSEWIFSFGQFELMYTHYYTFFGSRLHFTYVSICCMSTFCTHLLFEMDLSLAVDFFFLSYNFPLIHYWLHFHILLQQSP